MSETLIRVPKALATSQVEFLSENIAIEWDTTKVIQNIVVAGACLQCVNGNMAVSQTN